MKNFPKYKISIYKHKIKNIVDYKEYLIIKKLLSVIEDANNMLYNRHYGFPTNKSHKEQHAAVPYKAVNNPVPNSEFSDIDIQIILTIFTYFHHKKIRDYDISQLLEYHSQLYININQMNLDLEVFKYLIYDYNFIDFLSLS